MRLAVIGNPVAHSLSPHIFSIIKKITGHKIFYEKILLATSELNFFLKMVKKTGLVGVNVTLPFKEKILSYCDFQTPEVSKIKASNVLVFKNKEIHAYNTDIWGIEKTFDYHQIDLNAKKVVVYGAGGAARSCVYALAKGGVKEIIIQNRTQSKAISLQREMQSIFPKTKILTLPLEKKCAAQGYINTTSLGLKGEEFPFLPLRIPSQAFLFDMIYHQRTDFLQRGEQDKLKICDGLDMLVAQALASYQLWNQSFKAGPEDHQRIIDFLRKKVL